MDFPPGKTEPVAVNTLRAEQTVCLVHEDGVVDGHGELDMAGMAGTLRLAKVTCCAAILSKHHISQHHYPNRVGEEQTTQRVRERVSQ